MEVPVVEEEAEDQAIFPTVGVIRILTMKKERWGKRKETYGIQNYLLLCKVSFFLNHQTKRLGSDLLPALGSGLHHLAPTGAGRSTLEHKFFIVVCKPR